MSAIAIDFGTSNTVVARWNPITQVAEIIRLPEISLQAEPNPALVPSLVYVVDAARPELLVGQAVRDRGLDISSDLRFFRSFKRGIGCEVEGFLPQLDGQEVTFKQVGQWFLNQVIEQLDATDLILTVPVDSFEAYRHWLAGVFDGLAIEKVRLIDEPTAAALGYGQASDQPILVFDFGGGTLDMSLVKLEAAVQKNPFGLILKWGEKSAQDLAKQKTRTARVLAKAGYNLGGNDIDNWIVDFWHNTRGIAKTALTVRLAEKLKIELSQSSQAEEVYFDEASFTSYELKLDRAQLMAILKERGFFQQLDKTMSQLLQQARRQGVEPQDIGRVLLVGGTTQIPAVRQWLEEYFPPAKISADQPFTAIAQGAMQLQKGITIQDFLYHSYGIRYWDRRANCHNWHTLISAGQPYPMLQPVELLLGASLANQPSIELVIGELGVENNRTEVYFEGDRLITKQIQGSTEVRPLNDSPTSRSIAVLDPVGNPGSDRIKVLFQVDTQCCLRITVQDLLTGKTLLSQQPVARLQ